MGASPPAHQRVFGLDLLRAYSLVLVVGYHASEATDGRLAGLLWAFFRHGPLGVSLFFGLSGWLVSGPLLEEARDARRIDAVRFWLSRWFKTIPPFLAVIAFHSLVYQAGLHWFLMPRSAEEWWYILTFRSNYLHTSPPAFPVIWSLAAEEQFYLLLPLLLAALLVLPRRVRAGAVFVLVLLGPALRGLRVWGGHCDFRNDIYLPLETRLDQFALPILLRAAQKYGHPVWQQLAARRWTCAALGTSIIAWMQLNPWSDTSQVLDFSLVALGVTLLFPALDTWKGASVPPAARRIIETWAVGTYAMYLMHDMGIAVARHFMARADLLREGCSLLVGSLLAYALYQGVERPSLKLRTRVLRRLRKSVRAPALAVSRSFEA